MNYGLDIDDLRRIRDVFAAHASVHKVVIFGSRAMGNNGPGSDIDLAIEGRNITFSEMLDIQQELESLGMLYQFDVQNIAAINDPEVLAHITRQGRAFYMAGAL